MNNVPKQEKTVDMETSCESNGSNVEKASLTPPKGFNGSLSPQQTLKERSRVPPSMYILAFVVASFEYYGGVVTDFPNVAASWWDSMVTSYTTAWKSMEYVTLLLKKAATGQEVDTMECIYAGVTTLIVGSIVFVLLWSPLRAGMWTGQRAKRHVVHRYLGLFFLLQYFAAWIEYTTNYENSKNTYLPHFISICGELCRHEDGILVLFP